jgi:AraC-like DNA-binding protein
MHPRMPQAPLRLPPGLGATAARRPLNIRRYVAGMAERGHAAGSVLAGSGLSPRQLDDPACTVDDRQAQTVIANILRLTGNYGIGIELGQALRIADLGIAGHAIMSARSLRHATALWNQFCGSLVGALVLPSIVEDVDGRWTIRLRTHLPSGAVRLFCLEEMLAMGLVLLRPLLEHPAQIEQVLLSYPAPAHAHRYQQALGVPVRFGAATTEIRFRTPSLDAPLATNDEVMNEICLRHCREVMRHIGTRSPLILDLRELFLRNAGNLPSLAEAAQALGIGTRTLRRRLHTQGTGYQSLRREFCLDLAREYLRSRELAPKQIGYLLGFQYTTTFRRAFKAWTGQTVRQYGHAARLAEPYPA